MHPLAVVWFSISIPSLGIGNTDKGTHLNRRLYFDGSCKWPPAHPSGSNDWCLSCEQGEGVRHCASCHGLGLNPAAGASSLCARVCFALARFISVWGERGFELLFLFLSVPSHTPPRPLPFPSLSLSPSHTHTLSLTLHRTPHSHLHPRFIPAYAAHALNRVPSLPLFSQSVCVTIKYKR